MGAEETFEKTYISATVSITLNVDKLKDISDVSFGGAGEAYDFFTLNGTWEDGKVGSIGVANNGSSTQDKTGFYSSYVYGYKDNGDPNGGRGVGLGLADVFTSSTDWSNIESVTLSYTYDSSLTGNVTLAGAEEGKTFDGTQTSATLVISYKDGSNPLVKTSTQTNMYFSIKDGQVPVDTVSVFQTTGITVNDTYVSSYEFTGLKTIPEPTTATLSLLALAGLAARRRRR